MLGKLIPSLKALRVIPFSSNVMYVWGKGGDQIPNILYGKLQLVHLKVNILPLIFYWVRQTKNRAEKKLEQTLTLSK